MIKVRVKLYALGYQVLEHYVVLSLLITSPSGYEHLLLLAVLVAVIQQVYVGDAAFHKSDSATPLHNKGRAFSWHFTSVLI